MAGVGGAPSSVAGQEQGKGERRSWRQTQCQQCGYWGLHAPWHPEHKAKYCNYCLFWWSWEKQEKRRLELQECSGGSIPLLRRRAGSGCTIFVVATVSACTVLS